MKIKPIVGTERLFKILKSNFLSTIIWDILKIYSAFILDSPTDLICSIVNLATSEGVGYFFPNKFLNFNEIDQYVESANAAEIPSVNIVNV